MDQTEAKAQAIKLIQDATEENNITISMSRQVREINNGHLPILSIPGPAKIIIEIFLPE